jgi:peptidoglycan L-alanyl-D-glutamate endopeptidase CwlK
MGYKLGKKSLSNLKGVHPDLVKVVKRAIELTECDFTVTEGLRTKATQALYVKQGKSQTMNSKHLDGLAVDLAAWVNGTINWNFDYYFKIADAVRKASIELGIKIKWGGAWRYLNDYDSSRKAYDAYIAERKKLGKKPFLDGVHFEIDN